MSIDESLLKEYRNKPVDILNYSLNKFAKCNYALKFGKQDAKLNIIGFDVHQNIQSYDYYSPKMNYSQSWSSSPFITTKDRFYDDKTGKIIVYQVNGDKMLKDCNPVILDYDSFILKYGKIPNRKYLVENKFISKENLIHDHFLSFDEEEIKNRKNNSRIIYGSIIYDIKEENLIDGLFENTEEGYHLHFNLDVRFALDYYSTQMLNTGSLYDYPKFSVSIVDFYLDENFNIIKSKCHDEFTSKTGFISAKVSMDSDFIFLTSKTNEFIYNDRVVKLEVPDNNTPFNGDELFD